MAFCPIDAVQYCKYSRPHHTGAVDFLLRASSLSAWDGLPGQRVMDVGCGPGTSPLWILKRFPQIGSVVAVDAHPEVVDLARALCPDDKIEYAVADITIKDSVRPWERSISKVISMWCLHHLKNQSEAFANIHFVLRPHGEAALFFLMQSSFYDALIEVAQSPKWKPHLPEASEDYIPESHLKLLDADHYREILEEGGYMVNLCERNANRYSFSSDEECRGFLSSQCSLVKKLPSEMRDEFLEELFQSFVRKNNGRSCNGRITYHYTCLSVLARKAFTPLSAALFD